MGIFSAISYICILKLSGNLYKYIGNRFKYRFYNNPNSGINDETHVSSFFIDHNPFARWHAVRLFDGGVPGVGDVDQFNIVTAHDKWKEPNANWTFMCETVDLIYTDCHETELLTNINV